jgi:Na+-translocating ferredoxin:NAD+ oxidoreductase RnfE subunit
MTDFPSVQQGAMIMIMMIVLGVILALIVLPHVDYFLNNLQLQGFDAGAGTPWDSTREFWALHSLLVLFIMSPGPMGAIIFLISVTRRNRRDNQAEGYEAGSLYYAEE